MSSDDYIIIDNDETRDEDAVAPDNPAFPFATLEKEGIFLEDESQAPLGDISSSDLANELNDISGIEIVPHESEDENSEL